MKQSNFITIVFTFVLFCSCKKDWLEKKRNKSDVTPTTLKDFQSILDNSSVMNLGTGLGLIGADNFYINYANWSTLSYSVEKNAYVWAPDIFGSESCLDWSNSYKIIEQANIVLDGLNQLNINATNETEFYNIKGQALFFRSKAFLDLVSLFANPYSASTSSSDLGIPVRLTSDVNEKSTRATVERTYEQIVSDLQDAIMLMPTTSAYQTRPSKTAAQALLARAYLIMEDYSKAGSLANDALQNYSYLIDYNSLPTGNFPFSKYPDNKEIIFYSNAQGYTSIAPAIDKYTVDSVLYSSYDSNDLRKTKYFRFNGGKYVFHGSYVGSTGKLFSGLATNELYFIRAEAYARQGNAAAAMTDLNTILRKRWVTGTYFDQNSSSADETLSLILNERRKEFPFTQASRWDDLRRLNKDSRFAITLTRNLNGSIYTLLPNDPRYVYPIPPDEIRLSGIQQNAR